MEYAGLHETHNRIQLRQVLLCVFALFLFFDASSAGAACVPDATTLCLYNERFQVTLDWTDFEGNEFRLNPGNVSGSGQAVAQSDDTGWFWFDNPEHMGVLVKALNGCTVNNAFWFFAAGATNMEIRLQVEDTATGVVKTYLNPQGSLFFPILDTSAFSTCNTMAPVPANELTDVPISIKSRAVSPPNCVPDATTLCLTPNRFSVRIDWTTNFGTSGAGFAVPATNDAGLFWFFSPDNFEVFVNVIDGTNTNGYFWVFSAGLTNVEITLTVTDTSTGAQQVYVNPMGRPFETILDNMAFGIPTTEDATPVPTVAGWGTIIFGVLAGLASLRKISRSYGSYS